MLYIPLGSKIDFLRKVRGEVSSSRGDVVACSKSDLIGIVVRLSQVSVIAVLVVGERELLAVSGTRSSILDLFRKFAVRRDVILPTVRMSKRSRIG